MIWEYILIQVVNLYATILVIYICLTWIPVRQGLFATIMDYLEKICEPYLKLFRNLIAPIGGMIDITPIIALLVLQFGARLIVGIF